MLQEKGGAPLSPGCCPAQGGPTPPPSEGHARRKGGRKEGIGGLRQHQWGIPAGGVLSRGPCVCVQLASAGAQTLQGLLPGPVALRGSGLWHAERKGTRRLAQAGSRPGPAPPQGRQPVARRGDNSHPPRGCSVPGKPPPPPQPPAGSCCLAPERRDAGRKELPAAWHRHQGHATPGGPLAQSRSTQVAGSQRLDTLGRPREARERKPRCGWQESGGRLEDVDLVTLDTVQVVIQRQQDLRGGGGELRPAGKQQAGQPSFCRGAGAAPGGSQTPPRTERA